MSVDDRSTRTPKWLIFAIEAGVYADSYRLRQQLCKTVSQYDISNTCVVRGDYGSLKNTANATLRRQVLNTTISDLFSTAAFGLFADSSADSSADSEELWDYDGHHFTEI